MESKEYIKMRSDSASTEKSEGEIAALKKKFQDLLDSTDLKKADEVLSKIMTIFLADLSLHLSADKEKDLSAGKLQCAISGSAKTIVETKTTGLVTNLNADVEEKNTTKPNEQINRYKLYERLLVSSNDDSETRRNLKKIELKDIDAHLKGSLESNFRNSENFFGSYKGRVIDIDNKDYGLLSINLKPTKNKKNEDIISGEVILFKNGREESNSSFDSSTFGYSPAPSLGVIYPMGPRRMLQLHKIENTGRIAGYMYERLPNGTTKTIGTFVLNRVDQF